MRNISLWDEGITNQPLTVCDNTFPFSEVSLPLASPQTPVFSGAPVLLISGWLGPAFYWKLQPRPTSKVVFTGPLNRNH